MQTVALAQPLEVLRIDAGEVNLFEQPAVGVTAAVHDGRPPRKVAPLDVATEVKGVEHAPVDAARIEVAQRALGHPAGVDTEAGRLPRVGQRPHAGRRRHDRHDGRAPAARA